MAGTLWKGSIHFDGISIPVRLHVAVKSERVKFHLLHRPDGVRLHQKMFCAHENKPVGPEEQVRGFEVEGGKYVLVDPEELDQTLPEGSRAIEVHEFVKSAELDPVYFQRAYHLEPDGLLGGYGELLDVLTEMGAAGICTWAMRKRSYFGALQAAGKLLRLSALRHADEIIPTASLELKDISLSEKELKIGRDLIGQMTAPFSPLKYPDEHQVKLKQLIEKKARGEKVVVLRPNLLQPTPPDKLLEALRASLKEVV